MPNRSAPVRAPYFTKSQIVALVPVSLTTVNKAIREEELVVTRVGRRVFISRESLKAWANLSDDDLDNAFIR